MAKDNFQKFKDEVDSLINSKRSVYLQGSVKNSNLQGDKRKAQDFYLSSRISNEIRSGIIKLLNKYFPEN